MNEIFLSLASYKQAFNAGLLRLAQDKSLGTFILAMANATFDKTIYNEVKNSLNLNFAELKENYQQAFSLGERVNAVDEDLLVFLKMLCVGFNDLKLTEFRMESDWALQFNHVRGFRPTRMSQLKIDNLRAEFSVEGFHFNKGFMAKERLWEGEFNKQTLSVYYNKYPFAHYHSLLVPEREKQLPQFLELKQHEWMWHFLASIEHAFPGIGVGYNSRGAFSSVNHLHFQLFIADQGLPVTAEKWRHNGGKELYPAECHVFHSLQDSCTFIERMHNSNTAFNLLYSLNRVYCFPRKKQGSYVHAPWTAGFSWYELSGAMMTASKDSYLSLSDADIRAEFGLLKLD